MAQEADNGWDCVKAETLLREFVTIDTWKSMSRKVAREKLEEKMAMAPDSLKDQKKDINEILDKIVSELTTANDGSAGDGETDVDEEEAEQLKKKRKTGPDPPKNIKKLQSSIMSRQSFLDRAPVLQSKVGDLEFEMKPRKFSSASCGWFYGGKVAIRVGDQDVWCQLGVNCTVLGSKEWCENTKAGK